MILRSLTRRPNSLASRAAFSATRGTSPLARSLHSVPTLANHVELQQNGIPGLMSAKGFDIAYTQYHQHILDSLNFIIAGTPKENMEPKALVVDTAREPNNAYLFNHASMAFNNHFFFSGINTNPDVVSRPSAQLERVISETFSSVDTLRATFLSTADAMFGPGFVWLVQTNDNAARQELRILSTYLAGSPLSGAHYRRQSVDLNTHNPDSYEATNSVGSFGAAAKEKMLPKKPLGGIDVIPLLCVNTWQHTYLNDYGVAGKAAYLQKWWDAIDWSKVEEKVTITKQARDSRPAQAKFHYGA
ncbi:manganese and iron superoxide dismutase [Corynespora cassiicola Philippines]|uniref:Manganese and iron superoxide dismutase n=1 Tax=Corynespora cassiicola Philippines TaxID=1448308 RepID=A0A2T2N584_CORCC|nr:manganese and iron superoxide dismutase [Corynespora cassiicola Philippines]